MQYCQDLEWLVAGTLEGSSKLWLLICQVMLGILALPMLAPWQVESDLPQQGCRFWRWEQMLMHSIGEYLKRFCKRPSPQVGERHEAIPDSLYPSWQSQYSLPGGL